MIDWTGVALGAAALMFGGVLKGATGLGAPVLAVPLLSAFYGVPAAVVLFSLPNFLANGLQSWQFRSSLAPAGLVWPFAGAGLAGAGVGTLILVSLPAEALLLTLALAVFAYIAFRLLRPDWGMAMTLGCRLSGPVGFIGGVMFGAVGLSAPVSIPFLNALQLRREVFISTISIFFFSLALMQIPMLVATGTMTPPLALGSLLAVVPLWLGMPVGAFLARYISPRAFDRLTLALLGGIGLRMLVQALG